MKKQTGCRCQVSGFRVQEAGGKWPLNTLRAAMLCVALAAGLLAGTAHGAGPDYLATGGDRSFWTNYPGTATQTVYGIHQFTNTVGTTNFTPSQNLTVEYLVIAGGGGGGGRDNNYSGGAGGGAGGYRCSVTNEKSGGYTSAEPRTNLSAGVPYAIKVGGGGAGGSGNGTSGTDSYISNTVAAAVVVRATGGGGGGGAGGAGANGGSGGGSTVKTAKGQTVTIGGYSQGFDGGIDGGNGDVEGGGGGAGQVGGSMTFPTAGNGGNGITSSITGFPVARGGGGGGGAWQISPNYVVGAGGSGGGGNGGGYNFGTPGFGGPYGSAGTAGTGGGGGGGSGGYNGNAGYAGGSGIVIVRYVIPPPPKGTVFMMK